MKARLTIDDRELMKALKNAEMKSRDLLQVEGAGAKIAINGMRQRVPVDTAATKASIGSHIAEATDTRVIDDIGPETDYAVYLEYGTGEYAENRQGRKGGWRYKDAKGNWHFTLGARPQPFVRPTATADRKIILTAIRDAFAAKVNQWPR